MGNQDFSCPLVAPVKAVTLILALIGIVFINQARAQPATLQGDLLSLPVVIVGDQFYRAKFLLQANTEPLQIKLIEAIASPTANTTGASFYDANLLTISALVVDGESYWADFDLIGGDFLALRIHGINNLGLPTNDLGLSRQPQWQRLPGGATDIGVGANGAAWAVGTDTRSGGYGIYHWSGTGWSRVEGSAVRIDVAPDGTPWIVNIERQIFRRVGNAWQRMPGSARDIGIGANGSVWVLSGGGVFRWNGRDWDGFNGSGVRIDVDPAGNPWIINSDEDVFQMIDGSWVRLPGSGNDISIGGDGSVWLIGSTDDVESGRDIFRWLGTSWVRVVGSARHISVDGNGFPWVLGSGGEIYRAR